MPHRNIDIPTAALTEYCEHIGILKLSLFGSVLRDDFHAGSDIDMLVVFDTTAKIHYGDKGRRREELTEMLQRPVDLRTPRELSPYFRGRVEEEAETLYCSDANQH